MVAGAPSAVKTHFGYDVDDLEMIYSVVKKDTFCGGRVDYDFTRRDLSYVLYFCRHRPPCACVWTRGRAGCARARTDDPVALAYGCVRRCGPTCIMHQRAAHHTGAAAAAAGV